MDSQRPGRALSLSQEERYALLEAAAVRLDLRIRLERFREEEDLGRPRGGLIRLGGQRIVILDRSLDLEERVAVLARALNKVLDEPGRESGYLPPAVRQLLDEARERSSD